MKKILSLTLVSALAFSSVLATKPAFSGVPEQPLYTQTQGHNYKTFENEFVDYSISYPANIFVMAGKEGEAFYGPERKFISKDGRAELFLSSHLIHQLDDGTFTATFDGLYAEALKGSGDSKKRTVTYKTRGKTWFVVAGLENGKVFYQKMIVKDGRYSYFIIRYPQSQKKLYDPIVEVLSKSFLVG